MRKQWKQWQTSFSWAPKSLQMVTAAMKLKDTCSFEEKHDQCRQHTKMQRHYFANKGPSSQSCGISSSHLWMWESDHKAEHRRIDAFELWCWRKLLSPLDYKEIKPVHPKGNQSWIFIWRTDAEAPIFWPLDAKNWLIGKDSDAGKVWRQEKGWQRMRWLGGITDSMGMVWVNSRRWWRTGRPGVLQSMGSQGVGHDWVTELNWLIYITYTVKYTICI